MPKARKIAQEKANKSEVVKLERTSEGSVTDVTKTGVIVDNKTETKADELNQVGGHF